MATFIYKPMAPGTGADTMNMFSAWYSGLFSANRFSDTYLIGTPVAGQRSAIFGDNFVWTTFGGPLRPLSGVVERITFTSLNVNVLTISDWRLSGLAFGNAALVGFTALTDLIMAGNDRVFGSGLDDTLRSGAGRDVVRLGDGNDNLYAGQGADTAFGAAGNDMINGEAGADLLYGGAENDTLYGGSEADRLFGQSGRDVMLGEAGSDRLDGGSGNDTLIGGDDDDRLFGGTADDYLTGESGADLLVGGAGADTLIGGAGADRFVLDQSPGGANIDILAGFQVDLDLILLSRSAFAGLGPVGPLAAARFHIGANAADASDRILYDSAAGVLWYDRDGTGPLAKVKIADIDNGLALDAGDFRIIA